MLEKKIAGYSDEISVAPGERIRFMVSCEPGIDRYQADIVRLISGDRQPGGPGYRDELLQSPVSGEYPGRTQETYCGSYAIVPHGPAFGGLGDLSLQATIFPTLPSLRRACLISKIDAVAGRGFALWTDPAQGLVLELGDGTGGLQEFVLGHPFVAREWYLVSATYHAASGQVHLRQQLLDSYARDTSSGEARHPSDGTAVVACDAPLLIAAASREDARGKPIGEMIFNGRIERPVVASRVLEGSELEALRSDAVPLALRADICAAWDFARAIETDDIIDISPNRAHGQLINLPIRAVRGSTWTGEEMNFRHAPDQYAAIHFLDDSLYDCEWDTDFELEIPAGTPSGHSSFFRRAPGSHDPRAAFIFEGVNEEIIGDFGLIGGGAAGLELDWASRSYGTPPHALTVATSEQHTDSYIRVNEDIGHMSPAIGGQDDPRVHADMVFFETPHGGAVFSTGSIGWISSLFHNNHDNNVSRITRNVLDRFLDATAFA